MQPRRIVRRLAAMQAVYWLATGIWPLLHMRSFQAVTGPKIDGWLVRAVSALIAVIGATIALAARRDRIGAEMALLGGASATALATVDVAGVAIGRISPVYLMDAAIELPIVVGWAWAWRAGALNGSGAPGRASTSNG
ncbi:MAG TPA: hypothetical protein VFI22_06470 [Thermomicrobiales bacterium]|nr:hypothetical protein [Thermomicrobiales bacterium]